MSSNVSRLLVVFAIIITVIEVTMAATTQPNNPNSLTVGTSTTRTSGVGGVPLNAEAGNVTSIVISDISSTSFWQGYYGNITGNIVLDDSSNSTLFSWSLASPSGEVFAVNTSTSVSWTNITCVNFTGNESDILDMGINRINRSTIQSAYNITDSTAENLSSTFNTTFSGSITIAGVTIDSTSGCNQAYTYVNEVWQQASFNEILLFDNASALVFATIVGDNVDGYQPGGADTHDFQIIVPEDGSAGGPDTSTTTYYFYVELE